MASLIALLRQRRGAMLSAAGALALGLVGAGVWLVDARTAAAEQRRVDEVDVAIESVFGEAELARRGGAPIEVPMLLRRAREQIDRLPDASAGERTALLGAIGGRLTGMEQFAEAEAMLAQAAELGRTALGDEHPQTVRVRVERAQLYRATGRTKEADVELGTLLPLLRERERTQPRELVAALQLHALLRGDEGKLAAAVSAAREALAVADARLAPNRPESAGAAASLALALHRQQLVDPALQAAREAARRAELCWPGNELQPQRIEIRSLLGRTLAEAGQPERGIAELTAALDATRRVHGRDSLRAGVAAQNLVAYQIDHGDLREANRNADEALRVILLNSLRKSYNVGAAFDSRGLARLAAGRDADARDNLVIATQTLGAMIGHDHPATRAAKASLAQALLAVEGAPLAAEAVRDLDFPPPPAGAVPQAYEIAALRVRAMAERLLGRPQAALELLERAAAQVASGHRSWLERARLELERGRALLDLGRPADAVLAFEVARRAHEAAAALPQPSSADIQVGLGRAKLALGDAPGAAAALQVADAFWRDFDAANPWAAEAEFWLARALRAAGRSAEQADAEARLAAALRVAPPGGHSVLQTIRGMP